MSFKVPMQAASTVETPPPLHVMFFVDTDGLAKLKLPNGSVIEAAQAGGLALAEVLVAPGAVANQVKLYSKDVAGVAELFARDDSGAEIQVTSGGGLNLPAPTQVFDIDATLATTDATPQAIASYLPASNNKSVTIWGTIQAREQTASPAEVKVWAFTAVGDRDGAGVVTAHLLDVHNGPQETQPLQSATWAINFTDSGGTTLVLEVTGEAAKNIDWHVNAWVKESA